MTSKSSPFAGLKLSEQVSDPSTPVELPIEQRLFAPKAPAVASDPTPPPPIPEIRESDKSENRKPGEAVEPRKEDAPLVGKEGSREVGKEASLEGKREGTILFDLDDVPYRKDSFLFTSAEFEKFDDVKLDLRRTYDLKATKNDLARCGLGYILDDYDKRGADSELVRRLRRRSPK